MANCRKHDSYINGSNKNVEKGAVHLIEKFGQISSLIIHLYINIHPLKQKVPQ